MLGRIQCLACDEVIDFYDAEKVTVHYIYCNKCLGQEGSRREINRNASSTAEEPLDMPPRQVYLFREGRAGMKELLGGKGAGLAEMTQLGLPVPPGFTITTQACRDYFRRYGSLSDELQGAVREALREVEAQKGERFGDPELPLLVSVRSGAVTSMPGMMDTILNLGLNDRTVQGLARRTGNERFAADCYRRLMQMFGNVVYGIPSILFEKHISALKHSRGLRHDQELSAADWSEVTDAFKQLIRREAKREFPQDVHLQLALAIEAVFKSWNNAHAKAYRKAYAIPDDQGTAVNIQAMVYGNLGDMSGTGVVFSRNPSTGEKELFGEYLPNAQGEDVVSGARTPETVRELSRRLPEVHGKLRVMADQLEKHYRDMQDIEFTVEEGQLFLLQTRNGKRTAQAAVKIAVDLYEERVIAKEEALMRIEPDHLDQLLHRSIREDEGQTAVATGLPASPGAATGRLALDAELAERWAGEGHKVMLVRHETTPEDIHGVIAAEGVLTSRGGMTSHAAVVARGMGKPCVCGCEAVSIDIEAREATIGDMTLREGELISIDGSSGKVYAGSLSLNDPVMTPELERLLQIADELRRMSIYTNADTPADAAISRKFGAEGVGLCRTEHMFMSQQRLPVVQAMILAEDGEERRQALNKLLPMQQSDFEGIFQAMDGLPVTIRLLDPPLHEFLPDPDALKEQYQQDAGLREMTEEQRGRWENRIAKIRAMRETNPMLGLRGCRVGLMFPEIYDMQIEALFKAAQRSLHAGIDVRVGIMIPLVGHPKELQILKQLVDQVAEQVLGDDRRHVAYQVGTMIEVPRAALIADQIAAQASFFSFGTNDLTQMTLGYSRDDAEGKFLRYYMDAQVLAANPFQVLDQEGVGRLIEMAVRKGKESNAALKAGLCGEHGGERESIRFCHNIGLDYISCSPYRVPYARIAAAQAAVAWQ